MTSMLFKHGSGPFGFGRGETYQVLTDHTFERCGSIESNDLTMVDDGDAITIFSFFHVMCRHEDSESCSLAQAQHMLPDTASCLWIKAYGWLILKDDANALAHLRGFAFDIIAIDPRPPAGGMEQSTQHFDCGTFPCPIGAKKAKGFAPINVEVYSLHCLYFPEGAR